MGTCMRLSLVFIQSPSPWSSAPALTAPTMPLLRRRFGAKHAIVGWLRGRRRCPDARQRNQVRRHRRVEMQHQLFLDAALAEYDALGIDELDEPAGDVAALRYLDDGAVALAPHERKALHAVDDHADQREVDGTWRRRLRRCRLQWRRLRRR